VEPEFFTSTGGKVVAFQKLTSFEGHLPPILSEVIAKDLDFHWTGGPIPLATWRAIVSFMKWTFDEHGCEAQCRLAHNHETKEWRVAVLPQHICSGLSTKEIESDDDRTEAFKECGLYEGFDLVGTVHHHCSTGAFQSGTDHADELKQPGYHVTLGHLNTKTADFHSRASFRGLMYPTVNDKDWLPYTQLEICDLEEVSEFPEVWKTRLKKRTYTTSKWSKKQAGHYGYHAYRRDPYVGFGVGDVDTLPSCIMPVVAKPYWLINREFFWDYMIAVYDCSEEAEMQKDPKLLPLNSLPWKSACIEAKVYMEFIVPFNVRDREEVHLVFMELFNQKKVKIIPGTQRWTMTNGDLGFNPFNIAEAILKGSKDLLGVNVAEVKEEASKVIVLPSGKEKTEEELITTQELGNPAADAGTAISDAEIEEIQMEFDAFNGASFETLASIMVSPPAVTEGTELIRAIELLFEEGETVEFFDELFTEVGTHYEASYFNGFDLTAQGAYEARVLATSIMLGIKATCFSRHYMEKLLHKPQLTLSTEGMDVLAELFSKLMPILSLAEVNSIKKLDVNKAKGIQDWLTEHLSDLVVKARMEQK
jgi:hypothetical protein